LSRIRGRNSDGNIGAMILDLSDGRRLAVWLVVAVVDPSTNTGPILGVVTNNPSGLRWSEASLARNSL